jgi:hypothetical protein
MGTLMDIILTNLPSKYTSAVFNQDLSNHCLIACVCYGSAVKPQPLITVKRSLKHFCEHAFLINLSWVSWKDIDLIPSVEDDILKSMPLSKNVELRTDIALGSLQI